MADLKQFSKNFKKDLEGDEEKPKPPGLFHSIFNMLSSEEPKVAAEKTEAEKEAAKDEIRRRTWLK